MIDFTIPEETKAVRDKVRAFVQGECHPAEEVSDAEEHAALERAVRRLLGVGLGVGVGLGSGSGLGLALGSG